MLTTFAAFIGIGMAAQIPPPGGGLQVPPIVAGPARIFLIASGKPTLQVSLAPPPGSKVPPTGPLAAPSGPIRVRIVLDDNSVAWLKTLRREPIFDGMIARCDATGRVLEAYNLTRVRPHQLSFPRYSAAAGGGAYFDAQLTPAAVAVNKSPAPVVPPRSVSPMRITGFTMKVKDKPIASIVSLLPFDMNLAATEYSAEMSFELAAPMPPGSGPVGGGLLELQYRVLARTGVLALQMKDVRPTSQGPRRLLARASGISFP